MAKHQQVAHVYFQPPLGEESGRRRPGEDAGHRRHQSNSSKTLSTTKPAAACQSQALGSVSCGNTTQASAGRSNAATKSIESDVPEK